MKRNRLCRLLEIQYPIVQAGIPWISNADLAAAISSAGGLGVITPTASMALGGDTEENLRNQIRKAKALCDKPLAVSLYLTNSRIQEFIDITIEEGVRNIITSGGSPALYTGYIKDKGARVLHLVALVRHAKSAEAHGVDAVIAEGHEGGGIRGPHGVPTFVLVPQIADAVEIPVVASGGITDARGLAAALTLGADGVNVGTRFVATHESAAHPRYKEAILRAIDSGTTLLDVGNSFARVLKSEAVAKFEGRREEASPSSWQAPLPPEVVRAAFLEGEMSSGIAYCGASAGMVSEILSAREVVQRMVEGLKDVAARLQ